MCRQQKVYFMIYFSSFWRGYILNSKLATSIMIAKFITYYETATHALWLRNFVNGLKIVYSIARPTKIFCDNSIAVFFFKNNKSKSISKHIDIKNLTAR
jgi:hypothetical protein